MADTQTPPKITRKMHFKGKVIKTTLAGAVIDIGMDKPGVVHIANLSSKHVNRVDEVVTKGQEVDVWVRQVKKDANHIDLTMIEPLALDWRDIKKGMVLSGKVVRLEKFGAFIEIGAERPGLAHISELTHDYIRTPEDAVKVGEEVQAQVIDFSRRKKQIKLSLKALAVEPVEEVEEQTPVLTAMEIAYRRAVESNDKDVSVGKEKASDPDDKSKSQQEKIIASTLKHKARSQ